MKRNVKRLTLNRETVRYLNAEEISNVHGASVRICIYTQTCYTYCATDTCLTECGQTNC